MQYAELGPALEFRLSGGVKSIGPIVDALLGQQGIGARSLMRTPEMLDLMALALNEVLHSVQEFAGEQSEGDQSSVELWAERALCIITIRFRGRAMPDWLLTNWDRAREPALLAPPGEKGWGWLLVREALDSVSHAWVDDQQVLFLERRL